MYNLPIYVLCIKLLDVDPQDQAEEEGANIDLDSQRKGKCAVIKTSTRQVLHATGVPTTLLSFAVLVLSSNFALHVTCLKRRRKVD